jgi:GntR family phosphonate transport system transcriptional regulator
MPSPSLWREIHAYLRGEIAEGRFRTGDRLPTEKELSTRFGVNRHTVRRALAELTAEGAVTVRRGSGAYVSEGMIDYRLGASVKFSQNILHIGRMPFHRLLRAEIVEPEERVARLLALRQGGRVVLIETLSEADGVPVMMGRHRFSEARFPDMIQAFRETGSISAALTRYGVTDYRRAWTRITAVAPSRTVARQLRQAEGQPMLRTEGLNLDMAGQPIEYATGYWAGSRAQFVVEGG